MVDMIVDNNIEKYQSEKMQVDEARPDAAAASRFFETGITLIRARPHSILNRIKSSYGIRSISDPRSVPIPPAAERLFKDIQRY